MTIENKGALMVSKNHSLRTSHTNFKKKIHIRCKNTKKDVF